MSTMPLARIHGINEVQLDQVAKPEPGAQGVLVEVSVCGICGSDLSYAKFGGLPGAASPMAIGHEFSGVVREVGAEVTNLKAGDRVVVNPDSRKNKIGSNGLVGAFAPYVVVADVVNDPDAIAVLPDHLSFEQGAMVEPLSVAMHAINRCNLKADDKLVIMGAGPIGLGAGIVAKYYGVKDIVIVDLTEKRLAVAAELGLTPFKADEGDLAEFLIGHHGANEDMGMGVQPDTDVYLEATGAGPVFQQIVELGKRHSRAVVVGVHINPTEINMIKLLMSEMNITAAMSYPTEIPDVIDMLSSGKVDASPLITHQFSLSEFESAFAQAQKQNEAIKVLVNCQQ